METKESLHPFDCTLEWMEHLEDLSLEELRNIRCALGHDVDASERTFLAMLRETLPDSQSGENTKPSSQIAVGPNYTEENIYDKPFPGIIKAGRAKGLDVRSLADKAGLSVALVAKLDRALIRINSIPVIILESIANVVGCTPEQLCEYLLLGPRLAEDAYYKSSTAPGLEEQEDFFDAVRADPLVSEERRQELLTLDNEVH